MAYANVKIPSPLYAVHVGPRGKPVAFTCHVCGRTSHHPEDAKNRFCANCGYSWGGLADVARTAGDGVLREAVFNAKQKQSQ